MTSAVITSDTVFGATLNSDDFLLVSPTGLLRFNGAAVTVPGNGAQILNLGVIFSATNGISGDVGAVFDLRNDGTVFGVTNGLVALGSNAVQVTNAGEIEGGSDGIYIASAGFPTNVSLFNQGLISGGNAIEMFGVNMVSFVNEGRIIGDTNGLLLGDIGIDAVLVNHGTIAGIFAIDTFGFPNALTIVNTGRLEGGVQLSGLNDVLDGRGGTTTGLVEGLAGDDTLVAGTAFKAFDGGAGNDSLLGGAGTDILLGGIGLDDLSGGEGNDIIRGGAGADVMDGGAGRDLLDYALSIGVNVSLETGEGFSADAAGDAFTGFEDIAGGSGKDTLTGDGFANTLYGRSFDDLLVGGGGNDRLFGQDSNDTLDGGLGADVLIGGTSADRFRFTATTHSPNIAGQRDRILDFVRAEGDKVDLSLIDANILAAGNQVFAFVTGAFTAAGQVRAVASGGTFIVQGNTDANLATIEFSAVVVPANALNGTDFIL